MIAVSITSITSVPRLAGRMSFPATATAYAVRIAERADLSRRVRGPKHCHPRDPGEKRLERLEQEPGRDVLGIDRGERVPQRREPALEIDPEELKDDERESRSREARGSAPESPRQSSIQSRKPPRNASSLCPSRQFGGSSCSSLAFPPPSTMYSGRSAAERWVIVSRTAFLQCLWPSRSSAASPT